MRRTGDDSKNPTDPVVRAARKLAKHPKIRNDPSLKSQIEGLAEQIEQASNRSANNLVDSGRLLLQLADLLARIFVLFS